MTKVAEGKATKIIIPSDLQNIATLGVTLSETLKKEPTTHTTRATHTTSTPKTTQSTSANTIANLTK